MNVNIRLKKYRVINLRTRNIKKQVWINKDEERKLKEKTYITGLSESELLRRMINDMTIREKPDEKFYEYLKELRQIGNNLNQIAHKLNAIGEFDAEMYKLNANTLNNYIIEIKEKYLL